MTSAPGSPMSPVNGGHLAAVPAGHLPPPPHCGMPDVDSHPATQILPFLFLGNGRDASDLQTLQRLNISRVLNVTSDLPGFHESRGILYKQLPAADSGQQNLRQFFDDAFNFIGRLINFQRFKRLVAAVSRRGTCLPLLCGAIDAIYRPSCQAETPAASSGPLWSAPRSAPKAKGEHINIHLRIVCTAKNGRLTSHHPQRMPVVPLWRRPSG